MGEKTTHKNSMKETEHLWSESNLEQWCWHSRTMMSKVKEDEDYKQ